MSVIQFLSFLGLAVVAAYLQALTGFAFALVLIGGVTLLDIMPVEEAAIVVGILTLINALQVLWKGNGLIMWRVAGAIFAGAILLLPLGYFLLRQLSANDAAALSVILGLAIMICSLPLARPVEIVARIAHISSTFVYGALSGLMTGLFAAGGPPVVYHLYRQPLERIAIAETLVAIFGATAVIRLGMVGVTTGIPLRLVFLAALTMPAVVLTTSITKRMPPPLGPQAMRKLVVVLLFLSGLTLMIPPLVRAYLAG